MMLTAEQTALITAHPAGMVATVNDDATPAVSPKATFVILNDHTLAFGNLRSPHTLANIRARPAVEVCFIDAVLRKAVRVAGSATLVNKRDAPALLRDALAGAWGSIHEHMTLYVRIDLTRAELILSPAYDHGATEAELAEANMNKLAELYGRRT